MAEIDNIKKDILDLITPYLTERAGRIYIENKKYKESVKTADLLFEKLIKSLTGEQFKLLDQYFTAKNDVEALTEYLVYQQGMRDFLNLFISLLKSGEFHETSENTL